MKSNFFVLHRAHGLAAAITGVVDMSVAVAYLMFDAVDLWYVATLILKLSCVALLRFPGRHSLYAHAYAISAYLGVLVLSLWVSGADQRIWVAGMAFVAHLAVTLLAVRVDVLVNYFRSVAVFGAASAVLYLIMASIGHVEVSYGRYHYFGGAHPNLGSEIFAVGAVCAAASLRFLPFIACLVPCLLSAFLMQGRAALLVMLLVLGVRILQSSGFTRGRLAVMAGLSVLIASFAAVWTPLRDQLSGAVRAAFLLDDPNRGVGTGFTGRSERWSAAWNDFISSPIFGQGFGYYARTGKESAHNFFMYALVELGVASLAIVAYLAWCAWRGWRLHQTLAILVAPLLALTVFNDRFLSINPYPFVLVVAILVLSQRRRFGGNYFANRVARIS